MLNLKTLAVCAALSTGGLLAVGCSGNKMPGGDSSMMDTSGMSKDDIMSKAQSMISQGQSQQDQAASMPDGDQKTDMMSKAKALIQKGQALMEKAKMM